MAIIFLRRNKVLLSIVTSEASLESSSQTTETEANGATTINNGTTSNLSSTANCSTGNQFTANGTTTGGATNSNTNAGGGTFGTFRITSVTSGSGITDYDALSETFRTFTALTQHATGRTTFTDGSPASQTETIIELNGDGGASDTFENQSETIAIASTETRPLTVDTTFTTTANEAATIGTLDSDSEPTTTTQDVPVTIYQLTTTTIAEQFQTVGFTEDGILPIACQLAFDTIYQAGECEAWQIQQGVGPVSPASDHTFTEYAASATTTQTTGQSENGNTTVNETREFAVTTTYDGKMRLTLAGIAGQATIIANVYQIATSSGPTAGVGETYSIAVPGSVTNTDELTQRQAGTVRIRQLGNVSLVDKINTADTIILQGVPTVSTTQVAGRGFADIGSPAYTFGQGVHDITLVEGSLSSSSQVTLQSDSVFTADNGQAYTANPILAFVPITGSFSDDIEFAIRNCCATTNLP